MRVIGPQQQLRYEWPKELDNDTVKAIRCSMSGLVRIVSDDRYLLIRGERIDQFQPVGGVFKHTVAGWQLLKRLGATHDKNIAIDDDSRDDLRVYVPKRSLDEFLRWYLSGKSRELSPEREFREELIGAALLDPKIFAGSELEWIRTQVTGIRWTNYFDCYELLVSEIFELRPNSEQETELRNQRAFPNQEKLVWVTKEQIERRGWENNAERHSLQISDHSSWIIG
jgi:hypothetical protein